LNLIVTEDITQVLMLIEVSIRLSDLE